MMERFIDGLTPDEPPFLLPPGSRVKFSSLSPVLGAVKDGQVKGTVLGPDEFYPEFGINIVHLDEPVVFKEEIQALGSYYPLLYVICESSGNLELIDEKIPRLN